MAEKSYIHPTADVQTSNIGSGTRIWQYTVVLGGAKIGCDVNICSHCFVENDVLIANRVTVKSGVQIWDGIRLDDDVFIGPNVTFTNDKFPRSRMNPGSFLETHVERGASVGGGAVILPGITIGMGAMVGAGAVVSRSIPPFAIVSGSPARIVGYVDSKSPVDKERIKSAPTLSSQLGSIALDVGNVTLHRLRLVHDMRGDLTAGELPDEIPFAPKRYFMVFNVPSEMTRGEHAHRECHQFLICMKGSCAIVVDDGKSRCEVVLNSPDMGIYIPPLIWGIQYRYSSDAILLVFASHSYNPGDYIRDYSEFIEVIRGKPPK